MNISTKKGDGGYSCLCNGEKLPKNNPCFELLGDIDELSALLGVAKAEGADSEFITSVQNTLLKIMSYIASGKSSYLLSGEEGESLCTELSCDISGFALPGENKISAYLHLARCVARRAERKYVAYGEKCDIDPMALVFLNRLSDALFVKAEMSKKEKNS